MVLEDIGLVLSSLTSETVKFLPNLVGAIILLVIGLVLGKVFGRVVRELLDKLRLDYYVSETEKPVVSLSGLFALITRWWIYLAFITAAISVMGISTLVEWAAGVTAFIPKIIGAAIILVVGFVLAEYIKNQLKKANKIWAVITGKIFFFFVMYVAIALALPILDVTSTLVSNILLIIIASVGIGISIALGLGLKDAVSDISKRYVKKLKV